MKKNIIHETRVPSIPLKLGAVLLCLLAAVFFAIAWPARAQSPKEEGEAELAQELSNPLADLMSIPIQMNYDRDIGPLDDGWKLQTNVQPVIPFQLNREWNLITRTIIPVIKQDDIFPGAGSQFGLGDINLSLFFSPKKPTSGGLTWGIGPVLLLPTATDDLLGGKKWGAGPAAVALTTRGPWTFGMLAKPEGVPAENWLPLNRGDYGIDVILRLYNPDLEKFKSWAPPKAEKMG